MESARGGGSRGGRPLPHVFVKGDSLLRRQPQTELGAARPERRAALETTLTEQYQAEALLASETPFAAEIVRPPTPSPAPTSASPLLVLALAAVVGVIIGVFLVFLRDALRSA